MKMLVLSVAAAVAASTVAHESSRWLAGTNQTGPALQVVDGAFAETPPPARWPEDPADSLYRAARTALADGGYRRAADMFGEIASKYPKSAYAADALYWQAFALYREGSTDSLRAAIGALDQQASRYPNAATGTDAAALRTRIQGVLARQGDADAREAVRKLAEADRARAAKGAGERGGKPGDANGARGQGAQCADPDDEDDMRVAALNALMQMDADQALPILREVLARRDECSVGLRKKAVFLVAQHGTAQSGDVLFGVIRSDPDVGVRREAVRWLGDVHGARTIGLLDSLIRHSPDGELRERAAFALAENEEAGAAEAMRRIAEDPAVGDEAKRQVIFSLGHHGDSERNAPYLRQLYPKLRSAELKESVIQSVGQDEGAESSTWLLGVARNGSEELEMRKKALFWAGQGHAPLAALSRFYDETTDPALKEHAIFVISQRNEREATDKLLDVARRDPNREMRRKAIFWLGERDDPRVKQLLLEIINAPSPR
jgi:HEAT repeat protein